jgi:hypothetical protein
MWLGDVYTALEKINEKAIKEDAEKCLETVKYATRNLEYMVNKSLEFAQTRERKIARTYEEWHECMEQTCKEYLFYEAMVKLDIDIPMSYVAMQRAYEDYEYVLRLGEPYDYSYFLKLTEPKPIEKDETYKTVIAYNERNQQQQNND